MRHTRMRFTNKMMEWRARDSDEACFLTLALLRDIPLESLSSSNEAHENVTHDKHDAVQGE